VAKLAFLGLGLMGTPMATRLLEAGRDLTVWNRTTEKTRPLADQRASTPSQAAAGVEAVITMVDAPVRGSVPEAGAGRRAIYVGADQSDFERAEPIRAPLGTLHHVGGPEPAQPPPPSARPLPWAKRSGWTAPPCWTCSPSTARKPSRTNAVLERGVRGSGWSPRPGTVTRSR
jgi:NAD binding domain of 6-phosphogluconate dehydrogenase